MAPINLKQLEAFCEVAATGSFRRAAERLNTTQPNISARIAALEERLGQRLMERDAGSVRLTGIGATLLPRANAVLGAVDDLILAAGDRRLFDGTLRLGVTEMVVHSWLGPYLRALKERFPNVLVELTVDFSTNLSTALFARGIDLALQNGPFERSATGAVELGGYPMIWVASPDLGLGGRALSLADIAGHPVLTHARGTLPFDQLHDHIAAAPELTIRLVPSTNMSACMQMTRDGLGVACLPESMVRDDIESGALDVLRYLWVPDALRFQARYDADTAPHFVAEAARLAARIAASGPAEDRYS